LELPAYSELEEAEDFQMVEEDCRLEVEEFQMEALL
jgi:hypothetical protein